MWGVISLPDLKMLFLKNLVEKNIEDDSIYFYGKWHGRLWEPEDQLHKEDSVSLKDIDDAKMRAAMQCNHC